MDKEINIRLDKLEKKLEEKKKEFWDILQIIISTLFIVFSIDINCLSINYGQ